MAAAVLITGANRGLGFEFARQYSAEGWRIFAACRNPATADELGRLAQDRRGRLNVVAMDVTDGESVKNAATQLKDVVIDVLINSAGIAGVPRQKTGNVDYESWAQVLNVNTMGPLRMLESFCDHIARSERRLVVTITSGMGSLADNTSGSSIAYRSSKAAVNMVMRSAAFDLAPRGIICVLESRMGQNRYGRPQGAVVATGERDCHATAHRYVRPKSIGQVLQLRRSRISLVRGAWRSLKPQNGFDS
jgi:NAD(P)-dependent dehydrogenase (short-subunit alcohol dehydrogenase family)